MQLEGMPRSRRLIRQTQVIERAGEGQEVPGFARQGDKSRVVQAGASRHGERILREAPLPRHAAVRVVVREIPEYDLRFRPIAVPPIIIAIVR